MVINSIKNSLHLLSIVFYTWLTCALLTVLSSGYNYYPDFIEETEAQRG